MNEEPRAENSPEPARSERTSGPEESSGSSLWEMLGRGVGRGLRAAKRTGVKLERDELRAELNENYLALGRIVAEALIEQKEGSIRADDPRIEQALRDLRRARELLEEAEAKEGAE